MDRAQEISAKCRDGWHSPAMHIVAMGGGFSAEKSPVLDDFVLSLTGKERPKACFLPTASGDADHYVVRFYKAFGARADASHVSLFRRERACSGVSFATHLLAQDLIYVGGGSLLSLLGAWRAHGLDAVLVEAWRRGIVLCGMSAGALCWFSEAVTAFHGPAERVDALGLLPYSACVHYDAEPGRREAYQRFLGEGMPAGYALEDGAALHFEGGELAGVVRSRETARAFHVDARGETPVGETVLAAA
jgi:dipeptidase E